MKKLLPILICIVLLLSGCRQSAYSTDFFAMDTFMNATVYGADLTKEIESEVLRIDAMLSLTNEKSDTNIYNNGGEVSDEFNSLLLYCKNLKEKTSGAFDVSIQPFCDLWQNSVPTDKQIENAKSIEKIGFGAIGKGYAAGKVRSILKENGVTSAVISLGGNVCLVGRDVDGTKWQVGIQHPKKTDEIIASITAEDTAVVTSGGYQRYFEQDGVRYHHIIDPNTKKPSESGIISATIITPDDALADAFSTAVYVMGVEKATKLYRQNDFEMIIVTDDTVFYTEGLQNDFKLFDNDFKTELITK